MKSMFSFYYKGTEIFNATEVYDFKEKLALELRARLKELFGGEIPTFSEIKDDVLLEMEDYIRMGGGWLRGKPWPLDEEIRGLIYKINGIPFVYTYASCAGHISSCHWSLGGKESIISTEDFEKLPPNLKEKIKVEKLSDGSVKATYLDEGREENISIYFPQEGMSFYHYGYLGIVLDNAHDSAASFRGRLLESIKGNEMRISTNFSGKCPFDSREKIYIDFFPENMGREEALSKVTIETLERAKRSFLQEFDAMCG